MRSWRCLPLLALLFTPRPARACGLCSHLLRLNGTIREAALVAVVTSTESPPRGAGWTTLTVERVLKGGVEGKTLRVRAWSGLCPYGFVLEPGTYLAFFDRDADGWGPVRGGCAETALPVKDGLVEAGKKRVKPELLVRQARAR